jgi:hypothetical protein
MLEPLNRFNNATHVICDLDKTYLETEFESWIKMAKIPFESPHDKITVPGASEVLELVRWGGDPRSSGAPCSGIHFVSSSPPQLRLALDGKLTLDHLEWSSDTFKNQSYNLRMARIDLLRHHIAYKTKAILDIVTRLPGGSQVILIGDNAEYDAFIYTAVRLFLERRMSVAGLRDWLRGARVEESVITQVVGGEIEVPVDIKVGGIFIRSVTGYPPSVVSRLEGTWSRFDHWAQVAWSMMKLGVINATALPRVLRAFHNLHGIPLAHLRWCVYKALSDESLSPELRAAAETTLASLGAVGASGPSRRMLSWEFDLEPEKSFDVIGPIDAKADSSQWYQSVEAARVARKQRRGRR